MITDLKSKLGSASKLIDEAFKKAVAATGAAVDGETAKALKEKSLSAYNSAIEIGKNLTDLNADGKIDEADLKIAAEKLGIAWDKIDPDLKSALVAGAVASGVAFMIPFAGQALALPVFAATTAYFYLVARLNSIRKK
jgi:hypothetical protein